MPQMAPMSWIMLFIFFSFMLIIFNTLNYYLYSPSVKKLHYNSMNKKKMNWSW